MKRSPNCWYVGDDCAIEWPRDARRFGVIVGFTPQPLVRITVGAKGEWGVVTPVGWPYVKPLP